MTKDQQDLKNQIMNEFSWMSPREEYSAHIKANVENTYDEKDMNLSLMQEICEHFDDFAVCGLVLGFSKYAKKETLEFLKVLPRTFDPIFSKDVYVKILETRIQDLEKGSDEGLILFLSTLNKIPKLKEEYMDALRELCPIDSSYYEKVLSLEPQEISIFVNNIVPMGIDYEDKSPSMDAIYNNLRQMGYHEEILRYYHAPKKEWVKTSMEIMKVVNEHDSLETIIHNAYVPDFIELVIEKAGEKRSVQDQVLKYIKGHEEGSDYWKNHFIRNKLLSFEGFMKVYRHFKVTDDSMTFEFKRWSLQDYQRAFESDLDLNTKNSLIDSLQYTNYSCFRNKTLIDLLIKESNNGFYIGTFHAYSCDKMGLALKILFCAKKKYEQYPEHQQQACIKLEKAPLSTKVLQYKLLKKHLRIAEERTPTKEKQIEQMRTKLLSLRQELLQNPASRLHGIF